MPKRISGKTKAAPGNRHLDSTNPLAAPSSDERTLTGTASSTLLTKPFCSLGQTVRKLSSDSVLGSSHMRETLTSPGSLNDVMTSTYTGIRKKQTNASSNAYRATRSEERRVGKACRSRETAGE